MTSATDPPGNSAEWTEKAVTSPILTLSSETFILICYCGQANSQWRISQDFRSRVVLFSCAVCHTTVFMLPTSSTTT